MFKDFYEAWQYLGEQTMYSTVEEVGDVKIFIPTTYQECIDMDVVKNKNGEVKIILQCVDMRQQSIEFKCEGENFENAIINMANLIKNKECNRREFN